MKIFNLSFLCFGRRGKKNLKQLDATPPLPFFNFHSVTSHQVLWFGSWNYFAESSTEPLLNMQGSEMLFYCQGSYQQHWKGVRPWWAPPPGPKLVGGHLCMLTTLGTRQWGTTQFPHHFCFTVEKPCPWAHPPTFPNCLFFLINLLFISQTKGNSRIGSTSRESFWMTSFHPRPSKAVGCTGLFEHCPSSLPAPPPPHHQASSQTEFSPMLIVWVLNYHWQ